MSAVYYKWINNNGCEVCQSLDGVYTDRPQRPHPNCKCTILEIDPSSLPGWCLWDEHLLLEVRATGDHEITFNSETNLYEELILDFEFTVLCRDGTIIHGNARYEDETLDLPFFSYEDQVAGLELVTGVIERRALEYAEEECPECKEEFEDLEDEPDAA